MRATLYRLYCVQVRLTSQQHPLLSRHHAKLDRRELLSGANAGRLHSLTRAELAEAELVAIAARRQERLGAMAHELPGLRGWTSLEQAIEESGAEARVVACTTASHVAVTKLLLESGKTVLLEKPISDNLEQARSLSPLVKSDSSNLMIEPKCLAAAGQRESSQFPGLSKSGTRKPVGLWLWKYARTRRAE